MNVTNGIYKHMLSDRSLRDLSIEYEYNRREDISHQKPEVNPQAGNAADPDYRLIGCDAVVAIEMIEHMLPHDLERLIHTVFGFIKPWVAIFTTPNGDFNVLFKALERNGLRRLDHMFEWSREHFHDWCSNIVTRYPEYTVTCRGIGPGPPDTMHLGCCSQLALFTAKNYIKQPDLDLNSLALVAKRSSQNDLSHILSSWESSYSIVENNMLCAPQRLNCSTFQVKKFSKTTQGLMEKNKMEAFAHTREVVNEIRHLTKMLNFNKEHIAPDFEGTWCNINWGVNAPYWNQYYGVVREYSYPFEVKTDETRILDLITKEVSRLIDTDYEHIASEMHKIEIPIDQLMGAVKHITTDVDKVKELLEWNGYDVVNDLVIHSRLIVENNSDISKDDDWQDDTISDTQVALAQFHEPAVDRLTSSSGRQSVDDGDDKFAIYCDLIWWLMKLALCTSKGRQNPPPMSWMQCKLYDLLSLTERAIERRRLQRFPFKAIEYHLDLNGDSQIYDSEFYDYNISITSNEFKECDNNLQEERKKLKEVNEGYTTELERTGCIGNCNLELVPYHNCRSKAVVISSGESSCSSSNGSGKKQIKLEDNNEILLHKKYKRMGSEAVGVQKRFLKKRSMGSFKSNIYKTSRTKMIKKVSSRRPSYLNLLKYDSIEYSKYQLKERKMPKEHHMLQSTTSRPIPASLIELCNSQSNKNLEKITSTNSNSNTSKLNNDIAATEECMFIGIVTEEGEETIPMRRHIGISPEIDLNILENEVLLASVINLSQDNENDQSQPIFIYDLDEPCTSKGIRHLSTDVQCGPDRQLNIASPMYSQTNSHTNMPKLFTRGIKIKESIDYDEKTNKNTYNYGTCTEICDSTITKGRETTKIKIKIKDSIQDATVKMPQELNNKMSEFSNFEPRTEAKILRPASSNLKIEDSGSELCESLESSAKSPSRSKNTSDSQIQSICNEKNVTVKLSQASNDRKNLVCGGIYVHSFKHKQVSEDVVYLGEWQRKQHLHEKKRSSLLKKTLSLPKKKMLYSKEHADVNEMKFSKKPKSLTGSILTIKKPQPLNKPARNNKLYSTNPLKSSENNTAKKIASKTLVSSHIAKKIKTINTTKKWMSVSTKETPTTKQEAYQKNKNIKNYLPWYLQRKIQCSILKMNKNENKRDYKVNTKAGNIVSKDKLLSPLNAKDLTKIPQKTLMSNINYMIFRNEIQTEDESNIQKQLATGIITNDSFDRSQSPQSQHSSTCSSLNSVATVRAVPTRNRVTCNRRNSTSSEKNSSAVLEAENNNKKFSRRGKNNKKPTISTVLCDNKENIPQSSKNAISPNRDNETAKTVFLGRTKSIYMAQVTAETSSLPLTSCAVSKTEIQPLIKSLNLGNICTRDKQAYEKPSSSKLDKNSSSFVPDNKIYKFEEVIESPLKNSFVIDISETSNEADDEFLISQQSIQSTESGILSAIRTLIENKLNIPDYSYEHNDSDSETVILSRDDNYVSISNNDFLSTIDTVMKNQVTSESEGCVNYSHLNCPSTMNENDTVLNTVDLKSPGTESDALSLESFASLPTSKFSEYYLADNELESTLPHVDALNNISSIQDIFERKELNTIPNVGGLLAIHAFSGFYVNEPVTGDQPDFVNFIDSETGSFAYESARQATSEEIFVSGRSSDTYESCYVDDDAYVPNWLFNMISQQSSAEESDAEELNLPLPMAIVEPGFDMNGNAMEPGIGVTAGAGDGRGMHSDHSQDSSGRGTSLSSSETSSGPDSVAILIDPAAFTAQMEHVREPMIGAPSRPDASRVSYNGETNGQNPSNHQTTTPRILNPVQIASDVDADVSSLETDAVDSDNF
ncbi:jg12695 [Pararge aegeria aegeria]|uniref:Small RNA 2'-O-methyltransferase n=1 Tax=Pararge aegeria aegeria TaxID=348720 RepID=A0A8S4S0E2_9NEOP|nr:jg12695 [Pararge aegeria aegeria]